MPLDANFLRYSALDAACTLEIKNNFWDDLDPVFRPAYDMTVRLFPVLSFMQTRGIRVSRDALEETKIEVLRSAAEKQKELNDLCGRELNVGSSKQCQEYFYNTLRIPPILGKEKRPTVNDMALQRLVRGTVARPGLRQAKLVQDIRGLQKLHGTYLSLEFDPDGRLRGSFNPRGTKFGRLSSSKTIFGTGTNLQNLPQDFKKFLVPDDGFCFVEPDKRQAEWIGVAYIANDANMLAAVEAGVDVHTHTANLMFHVDPKIIKLDHKAIGQYSDAEVIKNIRMEDEVLRQAYQGSWPRSMSLRQCGKKCLRADTEVLTPSGWLRIDQLGATPIAQWKDGVVSFVVPTEVNEYENSEDLWVLKANHVHQAVTGEHRILTINDRTDEHKVVTAQEFTRPTHWHIPVSGTVNTVENQLSFFEARFLAAVQADGSIDTYNNIILRVDKDRKLERAKWLLDGLNLRYTETERGFFIHNSNPEVVKIARLLGHQKLFDSYLLNNSASVLKAFLQEVVHWDGYAQKMQYFTTVKQNAEWVQTIAHITGQRCTVIERPPSKHGFGKKNLFWVKLSTRNNTSLVSVTKTKESYTGKVYCPTVESGFFLVRSEGKISVTGNSNHGLNYDEGYRGFALINEIDESEAKRIVNLYHEIYPGIRIWYDSIKRQLQRDRTLTNCFGRSVRFMGAWNDKLWKSAYSMLPQSTIVDSLNGGMARMYEDEWLTRELNADILAQVHDSILTQFPIEALEVEETFNEVVRRIKEYTTPELEYNGKVFKIPTDFKVGLNWGGAHPERNPLGMVEIDNHADFTNALRGWREQRAA